MPAVSSHPRTPRTGASSARICISALSGGGGKTLLSLGLALGLIHGLALCGGLDAEDLHAEVLQLPQHRAVVSQRLPQL